MIKVHAAIRMSVVTNVSALFPSKMSSVLAGDNISLRSCVLFFLFGNQSTLDERCDETERDVDDEVSHVDASSAEL